MNWKNFSLIVCSIALVIGIGFSAMYLEAQTISGTRSTGTGSIKKLTFSWTSSAGGSATQAFTGINGRIVRVVTDPDGTDVPTTLYDITLVDDEGFDVLVTLGANRSATVTEAIAPGIILTNGASTSVVPQAIAGTLTLNVTNAGNAKKGVVAVYFTQ